MFEKLENTWSENAYNLLYKLADDFCLNLIQQNVTIKDTVEIANDYKTATYQRTGAFLALIILLLRKGYVGKIISESNYSFFLNNSDLDVSEYIRDLNNWRSFTLIDLKMKYIKMLIKIYKVERENKHSFNIVLDE